MIEPGQEDIGKRVKFRSAHPEATPRQGVITSVFISYVFVRIDGDEQSSPVRKELLEWAA